MMWLALIATVLSIAGILFDVRPLWIQLVGFVVASALVVMTAVQYLPSSDQFGAWWRRRAKFLLAVAVLVVANLAARTYDQVFDFSRSKLYSFRPATIEQLQKIAEPIRILIFLRSDDKTVGYAEWLQTQCSEHTPYVTVEIRNINRDVALAKQYDVRLAGDTVLVSGEQWIKVGSFKEETLVPGIMRLMHKSASNLCVLRDHGEPDVEDAGPSGLGGVKAFLTDLGYRVRTVSLNALNSEELQTQCHLLMVVSPRTALLPAEIAVLQGLWNAHFPMLLALDPPVPQGVRGLLQSEGIQLSEQLVVNRENAQKKSPITDILLSYFTEHPLTAELHNAVYLPETQALAVDAARWRPILETPAHMPVEVLERPDWQKPLTLLAVPRDDTQMRRVVMGSGRGLQTRHLAYGDNQQLLLNAVRWLSREDAIHWLAKREADEQYLEFSALELSMLKNTCFYGLPALALLGCGVFLSVRRLRS